MEKRQQGSRARQVLNREKQTLPRLQKLGTYLDSAKMQLSKLYATRQFVFLILHGGKFGATSSMPLSSLSSEF